MSMFQCMPFSVYISIPCRQPYYVEDMGALKNTFIIVSGWCNHVWALSGSLLHSSFISLCLYVYVCVPVSLYLYVSLYVTVSVCVSTLLVVVSRAACSTASPISLYVCVTVSV